MLEYNVCFGRNICIAQTLHQMLADHQVCNDPANVLTIDIVGHDVHISNTGWKQTVKVLKLGVNTEVTFTDTVSASENCVTYTKEDFTDLARDIAFFFNVTKGK